MDIIDMALGLVGILVVVQIFVIGSAVSACRKELVRQSKLLMVSLAGRDGDSLLVGQSGFAWDEGGTAYTNLEGLKWSVIDQGGHPVKGNIKVVGSKGLQLVVERIS